MPENSLTGGALAAITKTALLIINPVSGRRNVIRYVAKAVRRLMDAGFLVTTVVTGARGDATAFSRDLGPFDLVVCAGGDGTLHETVGGLLEADRRTPVSYIPCGSTNDFALTHGLPTLLPEAIERAVAGSLRSYDIGRFGETFFLNTAAFGAFSWMAYTTDQSRKNLLGLTAYALDAAREITRLKPVKMRVAVDGTVYEDEYLLGAICNSTSVMGIVELPEGFADTCDGILEVFLIRFPKSFQDLESLIRCLIAGTFDSPLLVMTQGREIEIESPEPNVWALDGESSGAITKTRVTAIPGFLQMKF